jgi:hypothetical protein
MRNKLSVPFLGVILLAGRMGSVPVLAEDPPENQKYAMVPVVTSWWKQLGGPAGAQAEGTDLIKGHDIDDNDNIYWTESAYPHVRGYRDETKRIVTLAGSARGSMDGPLPRARFGGWSYNSTNLISVSKDGKHAFVRDTLGGSMWRHIDFEKETVSTIGPYRDRKRDLMIVRDKGGEVYAFQTNGENPPDCPGYRKLKAAPFKLGWNPDKCVLDVEKMRFYWHHRGPPLVCDLKTGKVEKLTSTASELRRPDTSGPFDTMKWHCPTGMGISPGGRYLFVGGGDSYSFYRLDLRKKHIHIFSRDGNCPKQAMQLPLKGATYSFQDGTENDKKCRLGQWPASGAFNNRGTGAWATARGPIYKLVPVK